jgi:hypothetical protein
MVKLYEGTWKTNAGLAQHCIAIIIDKGFNVMPRMI